MKDFRELKVWEKAHQLVLSIYPATAEYPRSEEYGIKSQIRRSAVSVPANIAEGCAFDSDSMFARHCKIALGSASELEYLTLLSRDLKFLKDETYTEPNHTIVEVKRMLTGLIKKLKADS